MFMVTFTMVMEMSGVKEKVPGLSWVTWSTFLANIINVPFSIGESIPPLIAMALPEWKAYQAAVSSIILGDIKIRTTFLLKNFSSIQCHMVSTARVSQMVDCQWENR